MTTRLSVLSPPHLLKMNKEQGIFLSSSRLASCSLGDSKTMTTINYEISLQELSGGSWLVVGVQHLKLSTGLLDRYHR
jgi:hypothetical protein